MLSLYRSLFMLTPVLLLLSCDEKTSPATAIRLVDQFAGATLVDAVEPAAVTPAVLRFDGTSTIGDPPGPAATLGWEAVYKIDDLAVRDALLVGTNAGDLALLSLAKPDGFASEDLLEAFEIRLRVPIEMKLHIFLTREKSEVENPEDWKPSWWNYTTSLEAGEDLKTYTLSTESLPPSSLGRVKFISIALEGPKGSAFAIELRALGYIR